MSLPKLVSKTLLHFAKERCFQLPPPFDNLRSPSNISGRGTAGTSLVLPALQPKDQRRFYSECQPNWDPNQIVKRSIYYFPIS